MPTTTPRITKDILASIPADVDAALKGLGKGKDGNGLKGADIARVLIATGHLAPTGNPGLRLRTYMRSHGSWVGQGRTYGMTYTEARRVAAGFIGKVPPPKGVRFAKGVRVAKVAPDATPAEVASAA